MLSLFKKIKHYIRYYRSAQLRPYYRTLYRLVEITNVSDKNYVLTVQVINKNITFKIKPEELLSSNNMVDKFSPRDIRTITYLGYLGIHSPNYKILAKRLSENQDRIMFALQKKEGTIIIKTAAEIMKEKEILNGLDGDDNRVLGYAIATESILSEPMHKLMSENTK